MVVEREPHEPGRDVGRDRAGVLRPGDRAAELTQRERSVVPGDLDACSRAVRHDRVPAVGRRHVITFAPEGPTAVVAWLDGRRWASS